MRRGAVRERRRQPADVGDAVRHREGFARSITPGSACACKPPSTPSFSSRTAFGRPAAGASGETGPMRAFSSVLTDSLS